MNSLCRLQNLARERKHFIWKLRNHKSSKTMSIFAIIDIIIPIVINSVNVMINWSSPKCPSWRCFKARIFFLYQCEPVVLKILRIHRQVPIKPLVMMRMRIMKKVIIHEVKRWWWWWLWGQMVMMLTSPWSTQWSHHRRSSEAGFEIADSTVWTSHMNTANNVIVIVIVLLNQPYEHCKWLLLSMYPWTNICYHCHHCCHHCHNHHMCTHQHHCKNYDDVDDDDDLHIIVSTGEVNE